MLFFIFFAFFTVCKANVEHDKYDEILRFTPLPDGRIITTFQFNISTDTSDIKNNEYNLFPKSFGQILATTNVKTLSLISGFNSGRNAPIGLPSSNSFKAFTFL